MPMTDLRPIQVIKPSLIAVVAFAAFACSDRPEIERPDPFIKVEFNDNTLDFILNEDEPCGTLKNGTPYVEAQWYRPPPFEDDPPFMIKGAGGWEGNTYSEPHTWIFGVYESEAGTQELGFAIYEEELPGFDGTGKFSWSGTTPLGDEMKVEVQCP